MKKIGRRRSRELVAAHELTELVHRWSLRWVKGHTDGDRYSCAAPHIATTIVDGLAIRKRPR